MASRIAVSFFCRSRNNPSSYFFKPKSQPSTLVRSHSFPDEGDYSSNTVDKNMRILRDRMEQVRIKERLIKPPYPKDLEYGWNYSHRYDGVWKRHNLLLMSIELVAIIASTIGLVWLTGSLFIFMFALIFNA